MWDGSSGALAFLLGVCGLAVSCGESDGPSPSPAAERAAGGGPGTVPGDVEETPPSIVLVTLESLRADHVSSYGYERPTTPTLDALAAEGTRFTEAHAVTSWTLTSHASLFTGLYPTAHQVTRPDDRLGDGYSTLAETLQDAGYQTAAIVSGPYLGEKHGLHQGFEFVDVSPISPLGISEHDDVTNPRMEAALTRFLQTERDPSRPLFLFLYFWDPHFQYIPPEPFDRMFVPATAEPVEKPSFGLYTQLGKNLSEAQLEFLIAQYDAEIRCTDECLGRVFDALRAGESWDDTAVVVTADHGEQFFEHGRLGHKFDLHRESVHVPLVVKPPAGGPVGVADDRLVSLVDVLPSLAELANVDGPQVQMGRSLFGPPRTDDEAIFWELTSLWNVRDQRTGERWMKTDDLLALRKGRHKLLRNATRDGDRVFDVEADPGEDEALSGKDVRPVRMALREELMTWRATLEALAPTLGEGAEASLSDEERARLRALGYAN